VNRDKTEAAYQRGDLLSKRRRMMEAWSAFCEKPVKTASKLERIEEHRRARA
jgi:hypothetical protein